MRSKRVIIGLTIISVVIMSSCVKSSIKHVKVRNEIDSLAYALGVLNAIQLKADTLQINPKIYARAMYDVYNGESLMNDIKARSFVTRIMSLREAMYAMEAEKANRIKYAAWATENEAFLEANKEKDGVIVTESGLQYEIINLGNGKKPLVTDTVTINYTGSDINGKVFDSSIQRGEPAIFPVNSVIIGFSEALLLMPENSKFKVYIPYNLAYGETGSGDLIEPYSTVIFEIDLLNASH